MAIFVTVSQDGNEELYFKISTTSAGDMYVERFDAPTVSITGTVDSDTIEDKVVAAIRAIQREDQLWENVQKRNENILFPFQPI